MTALTNFANVTLSSLYFDITKDVLYANGVLSIERRAVVDTLERVSQLFEVQRMVQMVLPSILDITNYDIGFGACSSALGGGDLCPVYR